MSYSYPLHESINLHVADRISLEDAQRQLRTADAILHRLKDQPGVILADEVGMGKTFVALAAAVSIYLKDKKPVVVMIPHNLTAKWPNDFRLFRESCITNPAIRSNLRCEVAERPEKFLNLLDDDEDKRAAIIFLTHGALTRSMSDGWIKLAIIQKALYRRRDTEEVYKLLGKYAGSLVEMLYIENKNRSIDIWRLLFDAHPSKWKRILVKNGFFNAEDDDPVSSIFINELDKLTTSQLDNLYKDLRQELPKRSSDNIKQRLQNVRRMLNDEAKSLWASCLKKIKLHLPLLIFDEAHHLKNAQTQLVTKLFHNPLAEEEAGLLTGQFDRMIFLTATPFQLGHHELFRVLERFKTINWTNSIAPVIGSTGYKEELDLLLTQLDNSQIAARKLDSSWGKLTTEDLTLNNKVYTDVYEWWLAVNSEEATLTPVVQKVIEDYQIARNKLGIVETLLKKYVIRHLKPRELKGVYDGIPRRDNLAGNLIQKDDQAISQLTQGLEVTKESMLPFLLAARLTTIQPDKRPVFAEGLASSFEAFRFTREERLKKEIGNITDLDDDLVEPDTATDSVADWYLDQLNEALSISASKGSTHPKVKPTVDRAISLWTKGEKVLVFCHYIATAKALRKYMSEAMKENIKVRGAEILKCSEDEVFDQLEKIADKITDKDSLLYKKSVSILNELIDDFSELEIYRIEIIELILRYMRTPSFLVRFAAASEGNYDIEWLEKSFSTTDNSGVTLLGMIKNFLVFLRNRREDREDYINHLKSIQPGGIRVKDVILEDLDEVEKADEKDSTVMANVRLCYGATKPEARQKLMKTFNTPFFPDILITSSVMAEGVDLHLNCRHIIHHDLCWNPSTLEQRTGRVDRIGAKAEKCGKSIKVYLPYISETQDEKMYRVVTERERWFNIVMGEKYKVDVATTDKLAQRIPLPEELANELSFNLEIIDLA
ncbi:helicase-related protein [Lacibacter sediminis]|uniref:DEAD/DEAH box helicase n=1 Tax=Lacibacter sediminis TaxID=2760713 RepID=A0A7G5XFN6_9BACT|nr:helicase-related protein [Lacibacter sediminis]QNA44289.1 hypothetical protein H4075_19840 [Lacibacter sediminis]